jgi:quercetin dioxygenase-like cupin family protein
MDEDSYRTRTRLISSAIDEQGGFDLSQLISVMRHESRSHADLSSLYFAGADVDHRYFLRTDSLAIGIAVLPEGAEKSAHWKRHPHQNEMIAVIEGEILLERKENSGVRGSRLQQGEMAVIPTGVCHRVLAVPNMRAAYVFVKTNPALEPRGEGCD